MLWVLISVVCIVVIVAVAWKYCPTVAIETTEEPSPTVEVIEVPKQVVLLELPRPPPVVEAPVIPEPVIDPLEVIKDKYLNEDIPVYVTYRLQEGKRVFVRLIDEILCTKIYSFWYFGKNEKELKDSISKAFVIVDETYSPAPAAPTKIKLLKKNPPKLSPLAKRLVNKAQTDFHKLSHEAILEHEKDPVYRAVLLIELGNHFE